MALVVTRHADFVELRLLTDWDVRLQRELESEVLGLAAVGARSFAVNLLGVSHIQYRVLPELLGLHRQVRQLGGSLVVVGPSPYLLDILAAGDVPRQIPVFPSEASAALGIDSTSAAFDLTAQEGERRGSGLLV